MSSTKPANLFKLLLKIFFTALLLYFVFRKIHPGEILSILKKSNWLFLVFAFVIFSLSQFVSSSRLLGFLRDTDIEISFRKNLKMYVLGMFYNIFLPGGVGGDGYKVYLLKNHFKKPVGQFVTALLLDRISGLWAVGGCLLFMAFFVPAVISYFFVAALAFLIATIIYYFIERKFFPRFSRKWLKKHGKAIIVQSLQVAAAGCILASASGDQHFAPYLFSFLLSSLASVVPVTVGGLGAREYVMMNAAALIGIEENLGVFITATFWLISAVASLPGVYYALRPSRIFSEAAVISE